MRITLCGSARFEDEFKHANRELTLAGHVVYTLSVYPSDAGGEKSWYTEDQKVVLDLVHLKKIENSDAIVLVKGRQDYIGESTRKEILYALMSGKDVYHSYREVPDIFNK